MPDPPRVAWVTAAVGLACELGSLVLGTVATVVSLAALVGLKRLERLERLERGVFPQRHGRVVELRLATVIGLAARLRRLPGVTDVDISA